MSITLEMSQCIIYGDDYAVITVNGHRFDGMADNPAAAALAAWDAFAADNALIYDMLARLAARGDIA